MTSLPVAEQPERAVATGSLRNHILREVSQETYSRLQPHFERVRLDSKQVLSAAGEIPRYAYFPEGGIVSFTLELPSSGPVEFGIVGREGISSFSAIRAGRSQPVQTIVQVGGHEAYRISSDRLRAVMEDSRDLNDAIHDFLYRFMGQMAFTAVSNARHSLSARLARWLLLCDDRLDDNRVHLTHEFMAMMLGSQRTSVTSTLHILEGEGAIRSRRGVVDIIDRARLINFAGEAYYDPLSRIEESR